MYRRNCFEYLAFMSSYYNCLTLPFFLFTFNTFFYLFYLCQLVKATKISATSSFEQFPYNIPNEIVVRFAPGKLKPWTELSVCQSNPYLASLIINLFTLQLFFSKTVVKHILYNK